MCHSGLAQPCYSLKGGHCLGPKIVPLFFRDSNLGSKRRAYLARRGWVSFGRVQPAPLCCHLRFLSRQSARSHCGNRQGNQVNTRYCGCSNIEHLNSEPIQNLKILKIVIWMVGISKGGSTCKCLCTSYQPFERRTTKYEFKMATSLVRFGMVRVFRFRMAFKYRTIQHPNYFLVAWVRMQCSYNRENCIMGV